MLKIRPNCLKRGNYVLDSVNFSKCVGNYRVTLGRLLKLKLTNLNYLNNRNKKHFLTKFSNIKDTKGYIYHKYFGRNPEELLEAVESKVGLILDKMDPNLLDFCKILLNFKINNNFMKLIQNNIDIYNNCNNLYHLLFYTLRYNLLSNDFRTKNRNKNFLIPLLLDSICHNFDEITNKFQILGLLYNFDVFHDHFTQLMDQYLSDPINIRFLRNNISLILNYFNKYSSLNPGYSLTHLSSLSSRDVLEHSSYNIDDLLAIFNLLLQANPNLTPSSRCSENLKLILLKINSKLCQKHSKLSHIVNLLNTFTFYSFYPYLSLLTLIDNDSMLSKLSNGVKLLNVDSLMNISNLYLNYSLNSPILAKFINLSLSEIFNHFNDNIGTISLFNIVNNSNNTMDSSSSMDNSSNNNNNNSNNTYKHNHTNNTYKDNNINNNNYANSCKVDKEVMNDGILKLTRKLNKLIHNMHQSNALTSLTLSNLVHINSFIDNFPSLTLFLLTPFDALHLNFPLTGPNSSPKSPLLSTNSVTLFNDIHLSLYNIGSGSNNSSCNNNSNNYRRNSNNNNNANNNNNRRNNNNNGNITNNNNNNNGNITNNNNNNNGNKQLMRSTSKLHVEVMNTLEGMNRTLSPEQPVLNNSYSIDILVNS